MRQGGFSYISSPFLGTIGRTRGGGPTESEFFYISQPKKSRLLNFFFKLYPFAKRSGTMLYNQILINSRMRVCGLFLTNTKSLIYISLYHLSHFFAQYIAFNSLFFFNQKNQKKRKEVWQVVQSNGIKDLQLDKIELQPALYLCNLLIALVCHTSFLEVWQFVTLWAVGLFKPLIINNKYQNKGVQTDIDQRLTEQQSGFQPDWVN